jgi:hypothetical protein
MIVTVTERGQFKRCRQQWDYGSFNRQALAPLVSKPHFELGTLIHRALEAWAHDPTLDPCKIYVTLMTARYAEIVATNPDPAALHTVHGHILKGEVMMANYARHYGKPLPNGFRHVALEQQVHIPIPNTPHILEMTLDSLVADNRNRLYNLERKTYGQKPVRQALEMNDQFLAYMWGITQLNIGDLGGTLYDGIAVQEKYNPDTSFYRTVIKRTPQAFRTFERQLALEANEMANNPPIYVNRRWEGCYDCQFLPLCNAEYDGMSAKIIRETQYGPRPKTK